MTQTKTKDQKRRAALIAACKRVIAESLLKEVMK